MVQDRTGKVCRSFWSVLLLEAEQYDEVAILVQPIECKAAVAWEANKPLEVCKVTVDPPGPGEVRVKVGTKPLPAIRSSTCLICWKNGHGMMLGFPSSYFLAAD